MIDKLKAKDWNLAIKILTPEKVNQTQPKNASSIKEKIEPDWTIETNTGEINFKSVGYNQYARKRPKFSDSQSIDLAERGGISFNILG